MNRVDLRAAVFAVLSLVAVGVTLALVVLVANVANLTFGDPSGRRIIRFYLAITLYGAIVLGCLLLVLVYTGVSDHHGGRPLSRLYLPVLAKAGFVFCVLAFNSVSALDLLLHDFMIRWHWIQQPEVRLVMVLCYCGVIGAFAWFLGTMLAGRGWSRSQIVAVYVVTLAGTAMAVLAIGLFHGAVT